MGSEYVWKKYPIQDTLLQMVGLGVDISDIKFKKELSIIFTHIIINNLRNPEDMVYLDFKIKKTEEYYKVIGNNIVTALWLSSIIPHNPTAVMESNECHIGKLVYTFDKKKKVLIKTIKNG